MFVFHILATRQMVAQGHATALETDARERGARDEAAAGEAQPRDRWSPKATRPRWRQMAASAGRATRQIVARGHATRSLFPAKGRPGSSFLPRGRAMGIPQTWTPFEILQILESGISELPNGSRKPRVWKSANADLCKVQLAKPSGNPQIPESQPRDSQTGPSVLELELPRAAFEKCPRPAEGKIPPVFLLRKNS